jgi:hypothetical protein
LDGAMLSAIQFAFEFTMVELDSARTRNSPEFTGMAAKALPVMWKQYGQLKVLAAKVGSPLPKLLDSFAELPPRNRSRNLPGCRV